MTSFASTDGKFDIDRGRADASRAVKRSTKRASVHAALGGTSALWIIGLHGLLLG
jgi:hypothetical protein